jgi:glycosyltransferase involved in cell wall biosynthesis
MRAAYDSGSVPMLSIVVPFYNEQDSVLPLVAALEAALEELDEEWELILVDDGSTDSTLVRARAAEAASLRIGIVALARNYGQSAAMQAGFDHARGDIVVTLDGDLQNDPRDIHALLAKLREGYDLVTGYRVARKDAWLTRKLPSMVANWIIRQATGVPIRDNGCSLKAYRREVLERVRLYSDMHRFIPSVAASVAGASIAEVPVRHHARSHGSSKYGLDRVGKVAVDLLTVTMIRGYRDRPMVLFGLAGAAMLLLAMLPLIAIAAMVVRTSAVEGLVTLTGISLCLIGLAGFLFMLGAIGEGMVRAERELDPQDGVIIRKRAG